MYIGPTFEMLSNIKIIKHQHGETNVYANEADLWYMIICIFLVYNNLILVVTHQLIG